MAQSQVDHDIGDLSDDSTPVLNRRHRPSSSKSKSKMRESSDMAQNGNTDLEDDYPTDDNDSTFSPHKASKTSSDKKAVLWKGKYPSKKDIKAKGATIKEIKSLWGKHFTKTHIPKCHRPHVKRGPNGKRALYRCYEVDPMKWLPSILKSILMIARLTSDKDWLKQAMNEIVRYRIKHTGNRKPQLVTTDFDVIEDMLVKDWDVPFAFSIRYKHLLDPDMKQVGTDEDIDRILQVSSDSEIEDDGKDDGDSTDEESEKEVVDSRGKKRKVREMKDPRTPNYPPASKQKLDRSSKSTGQAPTRRPSGFIKTAFQHSAPPSKKRTHDTTTRAAHSRAPAPASNVRVKVESPEFNGGQVLPSVEAAGDDTDTDLEQLAVDVAEAELKVKIAKLKAKRMQKETAARKARMQL